MTALDRRRIAALELRSKPKAPRALTEAATRLQTALSEALPGIPGTETRRVNEWHSVVVMITGGRSFDELLGDLAGRITEGSTTDDDASVFASLDPADLRTVGAQSAPDYIVRLSELMAMF